MIIIAFSLLLWLLLLINDCDAAVPCVDLSCALARFILRLPNETFSILDGIAKLHVNDIVCRNFSIEAVNASADVDEVTLGVAFGSGGGGCNAQWQLGSQDGEVLASLQNISFDALLSFDWNQHRLPIGVALPLCDAVAARVALNFSGDHLVDRLLEAAHHQIEQFIEKEVHKRLCGSLNTFLKTNVSQWLNKFFGDEATATATATSTASVRKYVNLSQSNLIEAIRYGLNEVVGVNGVMGVNKVVTTITASQDGALQVPPALVNTTFDNNVTLELPAQSINAFGLNTFTLFDWFESNAPTLLTSSIALRSLRLNSSGLVELGVLDFLQEHARFDLELSKLALRNISLNVLVDESTLSSFTPLQRGTPSCWPRALIDVALLHGIEVEFDFNALHIERGGKMEEEEKDGVWLDEEVAHVINVVLSFMASAFDRRRFASRLVNRLALPSIVDAFNQQSRRLQEELRNGSLVIPNSPQCPPVTEDMDLFGFNRSKLLTMLGIATATWLLIAIVIVLFDLKRQRRRAKGNGVEEEAALIQAINRDNDDGDDDDENDCTSLAFNHRLWLLARLLLPLALLINISLFLAANHEIAASVYGVFTIDGERVRLPPMYAFSLQNSVRDMWKAGVYPLAVLIYCFSGVWPYVKLVVMLLCWMLPSRWFSAARREQALMALDALGKWSLLDTYVLVMMIVAFRFHIPLPPRAPSPMLVDLAVDVRWPFYLFVVATVMSLILSHIELALHRRACDKNADKCYSSSSSSNSSQLEVLSAHAFRRRNGTRLRCTRVGRVVVAALLFCSLCLLIIGISVDGIRFVILGLVGKAMTYLELETVRNFSLLTLGQQFVQSSLDGHLGLVVVQAAFFIFAVACPIVHLVSLLLLWLLPLRIGAQRALFHATEVLNAWAAVDVFVVSMLACNLQIRTFTRWMVGDKCNFINPLLKEYMSVALDNDAVCFDVIASFIAPFWCLVAAVVVYTILSVVVMRTCHVALVERVTRGADVARARRLGCGAAGQCPPYIPILIEEE